MKKLLKFTIILFLTINFGLLTVQAQTPNEFKYQAVLRNADGTIMANEVVTVDISILQGSVTGTSVFTESHNATTTAQGLINLNIGSVEDLSVVNWGADTYFIEISVNSTVMGTSQLLSVPYAMQAKTAENVFSGNYNDLSNLPTLFDGTYGSLTGTPILFDGQWSSLAGTIPNVSTFTNDAGYLTSFTELDPVFSAVFDTTGVVNGDLLQYNGTKFVKFTPNYLTSEVDGSITNEIQDLQLSGNTLTITNNSTATDIDLTLYLDNTDNQNLDNVLTVNNDGGAKQIKNIADPTDAQDAVTRAYVDLLKEEIEDLKNSLVTAGVLVKDYDGNTYSTVTIGNQVWMAENLKVTHYPDGTAIPYVTDNTQWGNFGDNNTDDAYCFYDNDINSVYGALYTWAASMGDNAVSSSTNPSGVQGVCPDGWHLPSDAEWTELTDYLGGISVAGGKLKEIGTTHWNSPNTGATNESDFSALPGGGRDYSNGSFGYIGNYGYWWSATESSSSDAWRHGMRCSGTEVNRHNVSKSLGFSVRCLKD